MSTKFDVNLSNFELVLLPEYESHLRDRGDYPYSENTIRSYLRANKDFYQFLEEIGVKNYGFVKMEHITRFVKKLTKRGNKPSTIKNRVSSVDSFFEWLYLDENIEFNPFDKYKRQNKRKGRSGGEARIKPVLYENEREMVYDTLHDSKSKNAPRDFALFCFLIDAGVRADELGKVTLYALETLANNGRLKIIGKGNKEREIRTNQIYKAEIANYVLYLKSKGTRPGDLAFPSNKGTSYTQPALYKKVNKWLEVAGVFKPEFGVHTMRHTAASIMYKETGDILEVKKFLGHSSLKTTEIYVHSLGEV